MEVGIVTPVDFCRTSASLTTSMFSSGLAGGSIGRPQPKRARAGRDRDVGQNADPCSFRTTTPSCRCPVVCPDHGKHALGFSLVAANVNLAIVRQALGHKNIASTSVCAEPTDEVAGKAVATALASLSCRLNRHR